MFRILLFDKSCLSNFGRFFIPLYPELGLIQSHYCARPRYTHESRISNYAHAQKNADSDSPYPWFFGLSIPSLPVLFLPRPWKQCLTQNSSFIVLPTLERTKSSYYLPVRDRLDLLICRSDTTSRSLIDINARPDSGSTQHTYSFIPRDSIGMYVNRLLELLLLLVLPLLHADSLGRIKQVLEAEQNLTATVNVTIRVSQCC